MLTRKEKNNIAAVHRGFMELKRVGPLLAFGLVLTLSIALPPVISSAARQFTVVRVSDGDTIKLKDLDSKSNVTVRLVGIDAPETSKGKRQPGQPFSRQATSYLASLVLNKTVDIREYGRDLYGRTLGIVYVNGTNVNLEIVKAGLAEVYRGRPPSGFDVKPYRQAEGLRQNHKHASELRMS